MDKLSKHHPAAFINVIAEEGSKAEAIKFLQETWNDYCELKRENERLRSAITMLSSDELSPKQRRRIIEDIRNKDSDISTKP